MQPAYFILTSGHREGPYREEELLDLWDAGQISSRQVCEQSPSGEQRALADWFEIIEPEESTDLPPAPVAFEDEEPQPSEEILWEGHPFLFSEIKLLLAATAALWLGFHYATPIALGSGLTSGFLLLAVAITPRFSHFYRITTERIQTQTGLLWKREQEIPLSEIHNSRITPLPFLGWLGYGDLAFETTPGSGPPVIFKAIPRANRLAERVRHLQIASPRPPKKATFFFSGNA